MMVVGISVAFSGAAMVALLLTKLKTQNLKHKLSGAVMVVLLLTKVAPTCKLWNLDYFATDSEVQKDQG